MINNKIILSFIKRVYRIFSKPLRHLKGVPLILVFKPYVFKIVFNFSSINQLKKEVNLTNRAFDVPQFSEIVVQQTQLTPFIAVSEYKNDDTDLPEKVSRLTSYSILQFKQIDVSTQEKATTLIRSYTKNHAGHINSALYSEFVRSLGSGFFDFPVPCGFMHGDFCLQNAIINNNKLYMIDWEHASENGSILYDWWFLKRNLYRRNQMENRDYMRYCSFIAEKLTHLNVERKQFEAFGHAMHAAVDFSRVKKRGESDAVLEFSIKALQKIMKSNSNSPQNEDYWLNLYHHKNQIQ